MVRQRLDLLHHDLGSSMMAADVTVAIVVLARSSDHRHGPRFKAVSE